MTEAARILLDQLMGENRDEEGPAQVRKYTDEDVCKPFLCGLCPYDMFVNTKMDLGDCPKFHSTSLRDQYRLDCKKKGIADITGYQIAAIPHIERMVYDCDKLIEKGKRRLESEAETQAGENTGFNSEAVNDGDSKVTGARAHLDSLNKEIDEMMQRAEELGEEGRVDDSMKLLMQVEAKKTEREKLEGVMAADLATNPEARTDAMIRALKAEAQHSKQKLRICEICSAFLSILDTDRRLADHFNGKMHTGFAKYRELLPKLREMERDERSKARNRSPPPPRDADDPSSRRSEVSGSEKDRDRRSDRYSSRDDGRDRSYDRDRRRGGDSGRYRDRDRDSGRDRDRQRDRGGRDRDRDRDRYHPYGGSRHRDRR